MKRTNIYKKLIKRAKGKIRAARIPKSFSKKNNNVFTNEKHFILQILKQFARLDYREVPDFAELLKDEIGLPRKPHFTTINKFALRAKPFWFEQLIAQICKSVESEIAAIDGTGFSLNHRSKYFCIVAGERKEFMHFNVCGELKHKLIAATKIRRKQRHETIDVNCLIRKSKQLKITHFLADKAYDSEKNHEIADKIGAKFVAPLKYADRIPFNRINGAYRKKLFMNFPVELYKKRVLIEGIFSAMKRRFGELIYAKRFITQKNELLCRTLAYNIEKVVNLSVIEIYFLQSLLFLFFVFISYSLFSHK